MSSLIVVDTDCASRLFAGVLPQAQVDQLVGNLPAVTFVTLGEARYGAIRRRWSQARFDRLLAFYDERFARLPCPRGLPVSYARLRVGLEGIGRPVGSANDLWIGAHALAYDLPLLTLNRKHFEPMVGLGLQLL